MRELVVCPVMNAKIYLRVNLGGGITVGASLATATKKQELNELKAIIV